MRIICRRKTPEVILMHAQATLPKDGRPIIISGPSGVGKGTLYHMLQDAHPNAFQTSISHTTRGPRPGEADKVDYYFVTMQEFEDLIAQEGFVEHAKFGGNRYGTSKLMIEDLQKEGKIVILDIEMEVRLHPFCGISRQCLRELLLP